MFQIGWSSALPRRSSGQGSVLSVRAMRQVVRSLNPGDVKRGKKPNLLLTFFLIITMVTNGTRDVCWGYLPITRQTPKRKSFVLTLFLLNTSEKHMWRNGGPLVKWENLRRRGVYLLDLNCLNGDPIGNIGRGGQMACRPVFLPVTDGLGLIREVEQEFKWVPGMAASRKRKNVDSLHEAYVREYPDNKILEVSSFSREALGVSLSAFNLMLEIEGLKSPVECFFQGSKVFSSGGPYCDLYRKPPKEAKRDSRIRDGGKLVGFSLFEQTWSLSPKTIFYDWLYLNALRQNEGLSSQLINFNAFTDIAFNPKKSLNCQARSVALFVGMTRRGIFEEAMENRDSFLKFFRIHQVLPNAVNRTLPF